MPFVERIEKLLINNQMKDVIEEFLEFLSGVPQSNRDARNDANQLRGQIIVLSGRFTDLTNKINTNTLSADTASQERNSLTNSFVQILNQLSSNYPDLNKYVEEKDEDEDWFDAQKKNNIETYHAYFNKYPNGKYKADTIKLISELEEVKQKQESEMKRLAMLEKERRENDKLAAEQKQAVSPSPVKPANKPSATESAVAAATKSKKGLFIGLGVVALGLIAFFIFRGGKSDSANQEATSGNIPAEELYDTTINTAVYYYIQNRDNKKIAGVMDGKTDDFVPLVLYDSAGKSAKDYVKFKLEPASTDPNNKWFFIIPKHSNKTITLNDINNAIPLYNYFGNHPTVTIESPKIRDRYTNPRDQDKNYNGKWLIDTIKNYVSANILNLNGGFINLPVAKFLAYDKYIMACIEHKYYDKIAEHTEVNNNTYINSLNKYINDHIQKIELTILTSKIAKFLDIENNTILSLKFNMYDQINNFDGTPDERLVKRINNYINRIINQCDKKLLNTKIMTYLEPQIQANLYVKFGEYDKLIGIQSYCIKEAFKVYYTADIFTVNQLNAILTANSIVTINDNIDKQQSSWKILYIQSFVPFKGTLYISVGQCKRKGEDIITINIHKTLSKQDKIRINNNEYTIKSMKSNNNKENDIIRPVFDLIEYTCLLDKNIDNIEEHKHYYVYKVRELN